MKSLFVFVALIAAFASLAAPARKILFIGNSLTYSQNGLYFHLERLTNSATPPFVIQADKSVQGGATLKTLWEKAEPRDLIGTGAYDVVILQEDIPEITVEAFRQYARNFVGDIRKARSRDRKSVV